jgi:hypothetical protein
MLHPIYGQIFMAQRSDEIGAATRRRAALPEGDPRRSGRFGSHPESSPSRSPWRPLAPELSTEA